MTNSKKAATRKATPASWKKGQSGNPSGRPKDNNTWSAVLRMLQDMTAEEVAEMVGGKRTDLGRAFLNMPTGLQMKYLISLRAMAQLMFEPTSTLWDKLMERTEGKVLQPVDMTSGGKPIKGYAAVVSPDLWDNPPNDTEPNAERDKRDI